MIERAIASLAVMCAGGLESASITCGDRTCPAGSARCVAVSDSFTACASHGQVTACEGKQESEPCSANGAPGHCHGGSCLPALCGDGVVDAPELCDVAITAPPALCSSDCRTDFRCGNALLDPGEVCDDGNPYSHDGCSAICLVESPTWTEQTPVQPFATGHALAFDGVRGTVLLFGGENTQLLANTLEWDGISWSAIPTVFAPPARRDHALAYDSARRRVVLFGGRISSTAELDDTWEWDGIRWRPIATSAAPSPRGHHAMAYDAARERVVLFGGVNRTAVLGDTWEWDGATWTQAAISGPTPRPDHAMAYDPIRGVIVIYGGRDDVGTVGTKRDTWIYDGAS